MVTPLESTTSNSLFHALDTQINMPADAPDYMRRNLVAEAVLPSARSCGDAGFLADWGAYSRYWQGTDYWVNRTDFRAAVLQLAQKYQVQAYFDDASCDALTQSGGLVIQVSAGSALTFEATDNPSKPRTKSNEASDAAPLGREAYVTETPLSDEEKQVWLDKTWARLEEDQAALDAGSTEISPDELEARWRSFEQKSDPETAVSLFRCNNGSSMIYGSPGLVLTGDENFSKFCAEE